MMKSAAILAAACGLVLGVVRSGQAADPPIAVSLATATPGGGFPAYGEAAAATLNATDPRLQVVPRNTRGSIENLELLERGAVDIALVAGIPAHEALVGVGRQPTKAKVIAAMYADFGLFAVSGDSPARSPRDLLRQPIAWGTRASGLTALGTFAMTGLGLDRDTDFVPVFVEAAGDAPGMLARGDVAAVWGGGVGWPNFATITKAGGRLIGFSPAEVTAIVSKHPFLSPITVPAGSFQGQSEALASVGSWSVIMARPDLPEETAYRIARALDAGRESLQARLPQARDTTPDNTLLAIKGNRALLHPGADRHLREIER